MSTPAQTPQQLSVDDFAGKIKTKYPQYKDIPNLELTNKVIRKYPQYKSQVKFSSGAGGSYTPESRGQKVARTVADALPAGAALTTGLLTSETGPGAVAAATAAGALGSMAKQGIYKAAKLEDAPKTFTQGADAVATDAATQGLLQGFGEGASALLTKVGQKAAPAVLGAVNRYLGLSKSDLPVWERMNVKGAEEVAQTVLEKVGIKKTLPEQHAAIEAVRKSVNTQTEQLVKNTTGGRLTNAHAILDRVGANLEDQMRLEGHTGDLIQAVGKNVDALKNGHPMPNATPDELFTLRRNFQDRIKWNSDEPGNVQQRFLKELYKETNDAIKQALPPSEARQFSAFNRTQNRLIIARDAAGGKLADLQPKGMGIASTLKRGAAGAAVGGAIGGVASAAGGGNIEHGVMGGAATGATLASVGFHGRAITHSLESPAADVAANQALAKVAPVLSRVASKSPQAARAVSIVRKAMKDIQGDDQKSVAPNQP